MARTTEDNVAAVIDVDEGEDILAFIDTASSIIEEHCTTSGYSDTRLELIERWLSAHLYACNRRRVQREGISPGPSQEFDDPKFDLFFSNTLYGQHALLLDSAGNLAALQNSLKEVKKPLPIGGRPGIRWLGSELT